jgi:hypothetical protein
MSKRDDSFFLSICFDMRNRKRLIIICLYLFFNISDLLCQGSVLCAFPGAEGYGKNTTGGRGGNIYYVTTTDDITTIGSLRYALNQTGPRIILFKVSGTIRLQSALRIVNSDVTIAGQTAPGDGICIRDFPVTVEADNVIIRFIRFRLGDESNVEADALGGRFHKNIIIDHCSMSWSVDECVSFYQNENFTLQWCLISESLRNSVHDKGPHGYGGIWGGRNASFHHNLLAHHDSRNPRLGEVGGDIFALTDLVDLRNNVIYNWQGNSCYGGEAMNANIVNCYYKPGPATTKTERIIAIDKNIEAGNSVSEIWGRFYVAGNYMSASLRATNDNWAYGVYNQYNSKYGVVPEVEKNAMRLLSPLNAFSVTTHNAPKAYEKVLEYAGASLKRDTVDKRIIHEVSTGTATFMTGGNGSVNGIIDTQSTVGGWPLLISTIAPVDSDNDGMADEWEVLNNLSPVDPADAPLKTIDNVNPNIEVYLNSLVSEIIDNQNKEGVVTDISFPHSNEYSSDITFNNSTNILYLNNAKKIKMIEVYSISGVLIKRQSCNHEVIQIQLPDLKAGIYIIKVIDIRNSVHSFKIVGL